MLERRWIVFAKESVDNLRDRRSLAMALAYPFIGPVLVGALVAFVGMTLIALPTTTYPLPVQGADNAPALIAYLEAKGARVIEAPLNPAYAVRTGQFDTARIIPPDSGARFHGGRQAAVHLVVDGPVLPSQQTSCGVCIIARRAFCVGDA